jgi:hypothetical protein
MIIMYKEENKEEEEPHTKAQRHKAHGGGRN